VNVVACERVGMYFLVAVAMQGWPLGGYHCSAWAMVLN